MNWPQIMILTGVAATAILAAALAWKQLRTQPRRPSQPMPVLVDAKHRAESEGLDIGRPGDDDQWADLTATVPGMSQRALAEAWQAAQRANERLGGDDADLS